jgi:hypothetical protein
VGDALAAQARDHPRPDVGGVEPESDRGGAARGIGVRRGDMALRPDHGRPGSTARAGRDRSVLRRAAQPAESEREPARRPLGRHPRAGSSQRRQAGSVA